MKVKSKALENILNNVQLGEMVNEDEGPTITFDGGDTHEGWYHVIYRVRETGLTLEIWDSGGYENYQNREEGPSQGDGILKLVESGSLPLARWSNRAGIEVLQSVIGDLPKDKIAKLGLAVDDAVINAGEDFIALTAASIALRDYMPSEL